MTMDDLEPRLAAHLPCLRGFVRLRLGPRLRAHESCSDVVQSVCRDLVEQWPHLTFGDDASLRAWLFRAALNKVRDHARFFERDKRDVARNVDGTAGADLAAGYAALGSPSAAAMSAEELGRIEAAFDRLTPDHQEVITLARLADLPLAEVGELMGGRSPAAISMLLGRALAALDDDLQRSSA